MNGTADEYDPTNQLGNSPLQDEELPELPEFSIDDDIDLPAIFHNEEAASTTADMDTLYSWSRNDLPNSDHVSLMEPTINNSNDLDVERISVWQSDNQILETFRNSSESATASFGNSHLNPHMFHPDVEVHNGAIFRTCNIPNAPDIVHSNGQGHMEPPPSSVEYGIVSVQDLNAAADGDHQSRMQTHLGTQQPLPKRKPPRTSRNVDPKRSSGTNKNEDPHCTCPKSRCLKLYCECFRLGRYCGNSCSCVNCRNNKDYEDTVELECEKIRLKYPNGTVQSGHRKGCNCRNSKCVKGYCECYQADVGCFEGCGCIVCENPFNRKSDPDKGSNSSDNSPSAFGAGCQQNHVS